MENQSQSQETIWTVRHLYMHPGVDQRRQLSPYIDLTWRGTMGKIVDKTPDKLNHTNESRRGRYRSWDSQKPALHWIHGSACGVKTMGTATTATSTGAAWWIGGGRPLWPTGGDAATMRSMVATSPQRDLTRGYIEKIWGKIRENKFFYTENKVFEGIERIRLMGYLYRYLIYSGGQICCTTITTPGLIQK